VRNARNLSASVRHSKPARTETGDPAYALTEFGTGDFFELAYSDGTQFVMDGAPRRIWATCPPPLTIEDLTIYLRGPVMGFILGRRGITTLHASAVSLGGLAVVLCGESEAGKSTTAAALAMRGAPVLCEDITPLNQEHGTLYVEPGYPRVCLWPDAVQNLMGKTKALPPLSPSWEKCFLPLDGRMGKFDSKRRILGGVYLLAPRVNEEQAPRIEALSASEALLELLPNTYMNWLFEREHRAREFDVLSDIVASVPVRRIVAHSDPAHIGALCDLILADVERLFAGQGVAATVSEP
jgi:hypothetical protein